MSVMHANGGVPDGAKWEASAEALMLSAVPSIVDAIFERAQLAGVTITRFHAEATPGGVKFTATGHKSQ